MNLSRVKTHSHCFHLNCHQIKWPRQSESAVNIQTEDLTLTPPTSQNDPEKTEAFGSTPSHSPFQSPMRKPTPNCPVTQYCLEIQVISTKEGGTTPPIHLAGTGCGRHDLGWQIQPN